MNILEATLPKLTFMGLKIIHLNRSSLCLFIHPYFSMEPILLPVAYFQKVAAELSREAQLDAAYYTINPRNSMKSLLQNIRAFVYMYTFPFTKLEASQCD